jgi:GMP synthase (glutamine-hydrolysing)
MTVDPVLIVKTGTTVPNVVTRRQDFETWIARGMQLPPDAVAVRRVYMDEALPAPSEVRAVVVTGSSAMVSEREPWSERTAAWLRDAVERGTPVLGICYGHQLLAHAFGGTVENNPRGRNIGTVDVTLDGGAARDPLFAGMDAVLHVPVSHRQSVTALPAGARLLGATARDPNHAFCIGDRCWGVQFHPEFDADIVRGYIDARRAQIDAEGLDAEALWRDARDTAHGPSILRRFAELIGG